MADFLTKVSKEVSDKYAIDKVNKYFGLEAKSEPKDRIQTEIGDSKDPTTFQPQVKVMRWDNEVNFSVMSLK